MTPTNKKQLLKVGLESGIDFDGEGADTVNSRCARFVLLSVAGGLRGDQFELGMQAGIEVLAGKFYSPRQISRSISVLVKAGLLRRVRARAGRGTAGEAPAMNYLHPVLLSAAVAWAAEWSKNGPRKPKSRIIRIPLSFSEEAGIR